MFDELRGVEVLKAEFARSQLVPDEAVTAHVIAPARSVVGLRQRDLLLIAEGFEAF